MICYSYRCRTCATTFDEFRPLEQRDLRPMCPHCSSGNVGRQFSANISTPIKGYYDTTGRWIASRTAAADTFKARNEEFARRGIHVTESTGSDLIDPRDLAQNLDQFGVTDEGLDATHDHQVATGEKESRGRFVFDLPPKPSTLKPSPPSSE